MSEITAGMGKEQVRSVMQSHGVNLEDGRKRPSGGWEVYGQDPFAAGSMANAYERETGQRVEWAEVYQANDDSGSSVINLYYDSSGGLIH